MRFRSFELKPSPSISFPALGVWFCCQYTMNRVTCKFVYVNVLSSQPNIGLLFLCHAHILVTWYYWNQTIQLQKFNLKLILLIKESFNETNYKFFFLVFFFSFSLYTKANVISDHPFVFAENLNNRCAQSNIPMNTMHS